MITPDDALKAEPGSVEAKGVAVALLGQAQVAADGGRITDALAQLWHAYRLWPELPQIRRKMDELYVLTAKDYAANGRFSDAELAFLQAIKISPEPQEAREAYAFALYTQAIALYNQRNYEEAERLLRKALNFRPNFPEASAGLSFATLRLGVKLYETDPAAAEVYFKEALLLRPDFPEALEMLPSTIFNRAISVYTESKLFEAEVAIGELIDTNDLKDMFFDTIELVYNQAWKLRLVEPLDDEQREAIQLAEAARQDANRNRKQVVLISENMRVRVQSMAKALTAAGYEVILIYKFDPNFSLDGICAQAIQFESHWEALRIAASFRPLVYHMQTSSVDPTVLLMTRHKPGPVIYDYQDIFPGLIPGYVVNNVGVIGLWQTEVVHKADGVCCQDLLYRAARRKNGWKSCDNVLWFPNYGDETYLPLPRSDDATLRIISTGTIEDPDSGLKAACAFFGPLLRAGMALDIYLHPNRRKWTDERRNTFYADLLDQATYPGQVTLKGTVPADVLLERVRQADVGGLPQVLSNTPGEDPFFDQAYFDYGLSTRVCEFMSAGIVLVTPASFRLVRFIVQRYGYWMDVEEAATPKGQEKLRAMVAESKAKGRMQETFTMQHNISRLIQFYHRTDARCYGAEAKES